MSADKHICGNTMVVRISGNKNAARISVETNSAHAPLGQYLSGLSSPEYGDVLWAPVMEYRERTIPGEPVELVPGLSWTNHNGVRRVILEVSSESEVVYAVNSLMPPGWRVTSNTSARIKAYDGYPHTPAKVVNDWVPINRVEEPS